MWRIAVAMAALALLAACGGGGGGTGTAPRPPGFGPGTEPGGEQAARASGIIRRTDLFRMSRILGQRNSRAVDPPPIDPETGLPPITDPPELPESVRFSYGPGCTGIMCEPVFVGPGEEPGSPPALPGPAGGVRNEYGLQDMQWVSRRASVLFEEPQSGINIMEARSTNLHPRPASPDMRSWGAWMHHSGFVVRTARSIRDAEIEDVEFETVWRYALVAGDLTGTRPARLAETGQSVVWNGAMVGAPEHSSQRLTGTATVTYYLDTELLDASFTNITGGLPTIVFRDVAVDSLGRFGQGTGDNYIHGGFFGPDHVEAAGVFEQLGIVGAFGARRETGE